MSLQDIELDILNIPDALDKYTDIILYIYKLVKGHNDIEISINSLLENSKKDRNSISIPDLQKEGFLHHNAKFLLSRLTSSKDDISIGKAAMQSLKTLLEVTPSSVVSLKDDFL